MTKRKRSFPVGGCAYDEAAELAEFKATIVAQMMPRARELSEFLDAYGSTCELETLLQTSRESWDAIVLYWAGLPPAEQRQFEDACVPWWIEVRALEERITTRAKEHVRRHREREAQR
jgi:hypothetical protein